MDIDKLIGLVDWIPLYVSSFMGLLAGYGIFWLLGFPIGPWKYLYGLPFALLFYYKLRSSEKTLEYAKQIPDTDPELKVLRLLVFGVLAMFLLSALLIVMSLESGLNELGIFEWYDALLIPVFPLSIGLLFSLFRKSSTGPSR